jgi:hypothetical protein
MTMAEPEVSIRASHPWIYMYSVLCLRTSPLVVLFQGPWLQRGFYRATATSPI